MTRIRLVFLLLAFVLLVPMALLVQRALDSVALERRVSHRAVAERLFDEMERELTRLLRIEEERPSDDRRFRWKAAADPGDDIVRGWFEVDADGRFFSTGPADPVFEALVVRGLQLAPESRSAAAVLQAPGTTRELAANRDERDDALLIAKEVEEKAEKKSVSTYEALQSLNQGARMRSERQVKRKSVDALRSKSAPAPRYAARSQPAAEAFVSGSAEAPRDPAADAAGDEGLAGSAEVVVPAPASAPLAPSIAVHPIEGRLIDAEHLLLFRRVERGPRTWRQGLVLLLPALFERLDAVSLGSGGLADWVEPVFFVAGAEPATGRGSEGFRYRHRFAEPFDGLQVRLDLAALPGAGSAGSVYAIAALLLVTGTLGLYAVYRMVAVTVRFAERRSNFVAAVTHELKTPLTAIRMYSEMLRDGMVADDDQRERYYGTLTAESERLSRLIDNVLEFSRLEQGTRETSLVVGSIGPVVAEAAAILEPHARELGFRIDVDVAPGLPAVRFDRDAVVQVVFNLVDNALKYARSAGERVVAIHCVAAGEGVALRVRDHGPGVAAQHVAQIFEPFYRGEDELTRSAKGTGIGLALVKGLAEAMEAPVEGRNLADGGFEVQLTFARAG